ncbi:MAG TPA: HAD family hydrolase [Actinopolymorphaceae bacterium]
MNGQRAHRTSVPAAFFDLDKTVIAGSSTLALARTLYRHRLIGPRHLLRSAYATCVYRFAGADHQRMEQMRTELSRLVRGWEVARVRRIVEDSIAETITPLVYAEAVDLITRHQAAGVDVYLVSSAGSDVVEPVAAMLGVDHVIATRMTVADGHYTGEISFYAYAEHKVKAIREVAEQRGYDLAASFGYSDSITDAPLLSAVGRPYAVNPDRRLRRLALREGWPILEFTAPTRRTRPTRPAPTRPAPRVPRRTATIVTGVATALTTALLWSRRASRRELTEPASRQR